MTNQFQPGNVDAQVGEQGVCDGRAGPSFPIVDPLHQPQVRPGWRLPCGWHKSCVWEVPPRRQVIEDTRSTADNFSSYPFDGPGYTLAHAYFPYEFGNNTRLRTKTATLFHRRLWRRHPLRRGRRLDGKCKLSVGKISSHLNSGDRQWRQRPWLLHCGSTRDRAQSRTFTQVSTSCSLWMTKFTFTLSHSGTFTQVSIALQFTLNDRIHVHTFADKIHVHTLRDKIHFHTLTAWNFHTGSLLLQFTLNSQTKIPFTFTLSHFNRQNSLSHFNR